jgi:hypothetical protein
VQWRAATEQDLADYRAWRCRAPQNPVRIGGSKWNREAAAFTKLFRWAGALPLPVDVSRAEDRAADSVSARVSWLTPRTWSLWSNVARLRRTIAGQREEIRDLRQQVTQLTLAAAVLARSQAATQTAAPAPGNVVPLRPDDS